MKDMKTKEPSMSASEMEAKLSMVFNVHTRTVRRAMSMDLTKITRSSSRRQRIPNIWKLWIEEEITEMAKEGQTVQLRSLLRRLKKEPENLQDPYRRSEKWKWSLSTLFRYMQSHGWKYEADKLVKNVQIFIISNMHNRHEKKCLFQTQKHQRDKINFVHQIREYRKQGYKV